MRFELIDSALPFPIAYLSASLLISSRQFMLPHVPPPRPLGVPDYSRHCFSTSVDAWTLSTLLEATQEIATTFLNPVFASSTDYISADIMPAVPLYASTTASLATEGNIGHHATSSSSSTAAPSYVFSPWPPSFASTSSQILLDPPVDPNSSGAQFGVPSDLDPFRSRGTDSFMLATENPQGPAFLEDNNWGSSALY